MAAEGGGGDGGVGGGGNEITAMSPRNRVKLLCSHGGKILPRPTDGVLKYVGGETRVVAFSREINFSELMQKLTSLSDADLVLKYQLIPEDLDPLVSVKSDEDLRHMLDEYDRHHHQDDAAAADGSPRLRPFRAFLFPSSSLLDLQFASTDFPHSPLDQRYIDAINGILRIPPPSPKPIFAVSSASTSPDHGGGGGHESPSSARRAFIHKVRSSPSLCSLNQLAADAHPVTVSPMCYQFPHHYHQNYQQYHHHRPPPPDPGKGLPSSYYSPVRQHKGDHGGKRLDNRADTLPQDIGE